MYAIDFRHDVLSPLALAIGFHRLPLASGCWRIPTKWIAVEGTGRMLLEGTSQSPEKEDESLLQDQCVAYVDEVRFTIPHASSDTASPVSTRMTAPRPTSLLQTQSRHERVACPNNTRVLDVKRTAKCLSTGRMARGVGFGGSYSRAFEIPCHPDALNSCLGQPMSTG